MGGFQSSAPVEPASLRSQSPVFTAAGEQSSVQVDGDLQRKRKIALVIVILVSISIPVLVLTLIFGQ